MLETNEQLDLSKSGQDPGQTHQWGCGKYVAKYPSGTREGCYGADMVTCSDYGITELESTLMCTERTVAQL